MNDKPSYEQLETRIQELEKEAHARKLADEVLRRSEERYRMVFNYAPLGIVHFDSEGLIVDCNDRFLEIVGTSKDKLIGFNMTDSLNDEAMRGAVLAGLAGKPNYYEGDYISTTGNKLTPVRAMYSRVTSEDGGFLGAMGLFEDISEQRDAALALRESKEFLDKIVNSISDPIIVKDRQHRLVLVNDAGCLLVGRGREELLGRTDADFFPKEQVRVFREKDELVFKTEEENENEEEMTGADGLTRTSITKRSLYRDKAGRKHIVGVIRNITDRKRAELALQAAHRELMDIVEFMPDAILVIDGRKRVIAWNLAMEEMTGVRKEDILGRGDYAYAVPFYGENRPMLIDLLLEDQPEIEKRYDFVKKVGNTVYGEAYVPRAYQGRGAYLWSTTAPLLSADGTIKGFIQCIRDITDYKHSEESLRQSEEMYRQLFETVSDAILVFDAETRRFVDVNERALRQYGYERKEFLEKSYGDVTADPVQSEIAIGETLAGIRTHVPLRNHRRKDGTIFPVEISSSCFILAGRRVFCGVCRDITERRRTEEELDRYRNNLEELVKERTAELARANERLTLEIEERRRAEEDVKLFAYSVAHDLKSPTIGLHGLTKRLEKSFGGLLDAKGKSYCEQVLKVSEHIGELVEKINTYIESRESRLLPEAASLGEIIRTLREEFSLRFGLRRIDWVAPPCEVVIHADRTALIRVFRNLLDNALKHGGSRLSRIVIGYEDTPSHHILSVSDNGEGLRGADAEKIFGLFQRQNHAGAARGAGLGLTIVKEIAERHGGRVWVEPGGKCGTVFRFSIAKKLPAQ
ncbi:MAG: PAS domain S-box protein [Syntrophobacteraceae bacterium]|nr:PAS domain S-box protein [Desulfobacteraceae bacterium]